MGGKGQTKAVDRIEEIFHGPLGTFEERLKRDRASEDDYLREESIKIGIEQGMEKEKIETATTLKNLGVASEIISKSTGLSLEEIENLK